MAATIDDRVAELERANAELRRQLDACGAELKEAREQQTATAEVLQVINSSPGELAPVFDAMVERAARLCEADEAALRSFDGELLHLVAVHGSEPDVVARLRQLGPTRAFGLYEPFARGERIVQIADVRKTDVFRDNAVVRERLELRGIRTWLAVALHKEGVLLGVINVHRHAVRPFTDKQIALLQNFAAQAVIAMENARLLTETREALEQQTATAEVLQVINSSPGDLAPVFAAVLDKAMRLCGVDHAALELYDGERFHAVAVHGASDRFEETLRHGYPATDSPAGRALLEGGRFVQIADAAQIDHDAFRTAAEVDGIRTVLFIPLRRDDALLGMIGSARREIRPFSDKEIALLENFAAQAVIAIENARLITETREALEQQQAIAEVLQVINSSPGDLAPVFDVILEKAHGLCEAPRGGLILYDGDYFRAVAVRGFSGAFADRLRQGMRGSETYFEAPLLAGERFIHIADQAVSEHPDARAGTLAGTRTLLSVPLRKGDALLGMIIAGRTEVRPFTDKQIALLQNFAAQAVIAMENARLITETREALEQQTATAEVLQVINSSPGDLAPVFDAMLDKAMRLCEAAFGFLSTYDGEYFNAVALHGVPEKYSQQYLREPHRPGPNTTHDRLIQGERIVHIPDLAADEVDNPRRRAVVDLMGVRTILAVPLQKDGSLVGAIHIYRREVRPFTEKQIALLQNFAAQAVIAMENARLITETREALEQQTATAEVLQVINSSPGDLTPVFDAILEKAHTLCGAERGALQIYDGEVFRPAAMRGLPEPFAERLRQGFRATGNPVAEALLAGERFVHISDVAATHPTLRAATELAGTRTLLSVPLRKDGVLLGVIVAFRQEVRPFSEKQIALLQNFAAQAVIAMENARLITETREALEQQTATAEVLQVINSSPGDLAPVFEAILDKARAVCGFAHGSLNVYDGEYFRTVAMHGYPEAFAEVLRQPRRTGPQARFLEGDRIVHVTDIATERPASDDPVYRAAIEAGVRTVLFVPLRNDRILLGYLTANRREARPFSEKEIVLLQNFAAQAVIAMENARLLTETREALEQQTATAEVLQVINSSPGDLAPVFDAILEKAHRLCGVAFGALQLEDGGTFRSVAERGLADSLVELLRQPFEPVPESPPSRLLSGQQIVHIADMAELARQRSDDQRARAAAEHGFRTALFVPLRKDADLLGYIVAFRQEVRPFSDKQIALLQNFAAQAVIAMENARLLTETREALEQQTATAEVLQVINSSPGDLAPVFDAILEKAHSLCGAAHGSLTVSDGGLFRAIAMRGQPEAFASVLRRPRPASHVHQRLQAGERFVQIADMKTLTIAPSDIVTPAAVEAGIRTQLFVPLRKDGVLLGYITAHRREVRPFSEKEIALLENFAAQAVIAIENARLITETREALEQQTATAEVLGVINSSPGDLAPVFDAMLEKARRLCGAVHGDLWTCDGELWHLAATQGEPRFSEWLAQLGAIRPWPGSPNERLERGEAYVHILDAFQDTSFELVPEFLEQVKIAGIRTCLFIPLRKEETLLGMIVVYRLDVRPFTDKQIALLRNFAAQAVIAMENARLLNELRQRTRDLQESLEYQTATSDVLKVISRSTFDLDAVMEAVVTSAIRLCRADHAGIYRNENGEYRWAGGYAPTSAYEEHERDLVILPGPGTVVGRAALEGHAVQIADAWTDPLYEAKDDAREGGVHTMLGVPLLREGSPIGVIGLARRRVEHFTDKQIELVTTFADQAVIAIENARLLNDLRQRTSDLQESLEYQTATSDVLKVISQSNFDLGPVLENVIETALRLCRAHMGSIFRLEDGVYRWAVGRGLEPAYQEIEMRTPVLAGPGTLVGRAALEGRAVQIADAMADPLYAVKDEASLARARTMLGVPLLREGAPIGVIAMARDRIEPFGEKEVALVTTFADQAVIAIENARLLNDLQGRTRDLQESLEYQTATSDVLKVISQSAAELEPVLQTLVETAARICEGENAFVFRLRDGQFHLSASFGFTPEYKDYIARNPITPSSGTLVGRTALEERVVHIIDAANDPSYTWSESQRLGGFHTMLGVPLFREKSLIGVLALARSQVKPFAEKQVALVTTFADQAVIAIENARLFAELRERTAELGRSVEELKMLSEVGRAVSSTLDLRAVLSTILTRSVGISGADAGAVFRYSRVDRTFRLVEAVGWDEALLGSVGDLSIAETETAMSEAASRRTPIQLTDLAELPSTRLRDASLAAGLRSVLIVPLVGPERIFGALVLQRREAGEFPAETVRLMQTLASQSVLAIQNARLFREIADKSEQLALASQHKSQFLANMSHELRTPLNAILGYAELLVDGIYGVLPEKAQGVLERVQNNGKHLLALINDVLDLAKIEAGQLTLTLEDYALAEVVRGVVTATEPLAVAKGLKFTAIVQDGMPMAHGDARRVSQVLLNLAGNAIKFTDVGEVEINASAADGQFLLTVRDTGPGIADADQERIFGEFQQIDNSDTRKKGGTGLGLAISKRMVEIQGGLISVDSVLGRGSTFRVVLPVHVEPALEEAA